MNFLKKMTNENVCWFWVLELSSKSLRPSEMLKEMLTHIKKYLFVTNAAKL